MTMSSMPSSLPGSDVTGQGGSVPGAHDHRHPSPAEDDSRVTGPQAGGAEQAQPGGEDQDAATVIADLQEQVEVLDQKWRRALADADNLRKRCARDLERVRAEQTADVARRWLPVVDNLDRALEHAGSDPGAVIEGVKAVRDQAVGVLADLGFPRQDDLGEAFDPARHDAAGSRAGTGASPGTVAEIVRPAYGAGDHQLRPAQVVVAKDC
jgi:molecular chaperone GrpE